MRRLSRAADCWYREDDDRKAADAQDPSRDAPPRHVMVGSLQIHKTRQHTTLRTLDMPHQVPNDCKRRSDRVAIAWRWDQVELEFDFVVKLDAVIRDDRNRGLEQPRSVDCPLVNSDDPKSFDSRKTHSRPGCRSW